MVVNSKKRAVISIFFALLLLLPLSNSSALAQSAYDQTTQLQQQLLDIQKQIDAYEKELATIKTQKNTLANKIKQLKAKQQQLTLQIQATTININQVNGQIVQTQAQIDLGEQQIATLQQLLSDMVRQVVQLNQYSFWKILLTSKSFSEFFTNIHAYYTFNQDLSQIIFALQGQNDRLQAIKTVFAATLEKQQNLLGMVSLQKTQLTQTLQDQNTILQQTKGKEANYQETLKQSQAAAAAIKSRIYDLLGITQQITFGAALQIAQWAASQTNVRPAFLLAILTQESNLGRNLGTCNRPGDPPTKSWKVIMKPERDQVPFIQITKELGMNPDITPVSCPMRDKNGNQIGWGGAMGPAQFIPSTWMGYRTKVAGITGKAVANPWDIRDAFMASALKLAAGGGTSPSGEWAAAMRYFSGGTNTAYRFYGDNVVALTEQYQKDINQLSQ